MTDARDFEIDRLQNELEVANTKVTELQAKNYDLLSEVRDLNKRVFNLQKGYERVKKELEELKKQGTTYEYNLLNQALDQTQEDANALTEQIDALQGENTQLKAINDNQAEQLKHYKALVGLNEPGF